VEIPSNLLSLLCQLLLILVHGTFVDFSNLVLPLDLVCVSLPLLIFVLFHALLHFFTQLLNLV
jgi:hypothetical protein